VQDKTFNVGTYTVGYVRDLRHGSGVDVGLGGQVTVNNTPSGLSAYYGSGVPVGFEIFFRIRPSRMNMQEAAAQPGSPAANAVSPAANTVSPVTGGAAGGLVFSSAFNPAPPHAGKNQLTVTLKDASGAPVTGVVVRSTVAMTSMDMGTQHPTFRETGNGRYVGTVTFTMAGPWRVTLDITPPSGAPVTQVVDAAVQP
ncbi:MAG: FixH family protein, partial [Chloroflexi bacterium]|nr:FixH family protein [Chloroflexota bacterium]